MCGRYDTSHLTWAEIHRQLSAFSLPIKSAAPNMEPNPDVRPTTKQLTVRLDDGGWVLESMRWGLVPFWRAGKPLKDTAKGAKDGWSMTTFNARVETCAGSSTFKGAFARRRCIVPASAWFEWTGAEGHKTKHRFARADGGTIWFAGMWDRVATSDQGEVASFTIITGPSAGALADYHDRAPRILEPDDFMKWLDPAQDAAALLARVGPERFEIKIAA